MKKIPKVGFDMDGVILYNPIKFVRPIAKLLKPIKSIIVKQKKELFYYPKSKLEQLLFSLIHKTSYKPDIALEEIKKLVKSKKIKAYIITGRYSFLKKDYEVWLKKIKADTIFEKCFQNNSDLQPNVFKEKMIKKLGIDFFIEDNWDIVQKLKEKNKKLKVFWITNFLDKNIPYNYKFNNLQEALKNIIASKKNA